VAEFFQALAPCSVAIPRATSVDTYTSGTMKLPMPGLGMISIVRLLAPLSRERSDEFLMARRTLQSQERLTREITIESIAKEGTMPDWKGIVGKGFTPSQFDYYVEGVSTHRLATSIYCSAQYLHPEAC
jgi:hypothetical protein